jgi:DNA polymerase-3 subunit epsilon
LSLRRKVRSACVLAEIGRCAAPCESGVDVTQYQLIVDVVAQAWGGDVRPLVEPLERKLARLSDERRYEQAATVRDRIAAVVRACARMQRLNALREIGELVAAKSDGDGGWELVVIRSGRLAAAGTAPRGVTPWAVVEALLATADAIDPGHDVLTEETETLLRWLEDGGTRLVSASHPWAMPAFGAGGLRGYLANDRDRAADPFADRRRHAMLHRPVRASA